MVGGSTAQGSRQGHLHKKVGKYLLGRTIGEVGAHWQQLQQAAPATAAEVARRARGGGWGCGGGSASGDVQCSSPNTPALRCRMNTPHCTVPLPLCCRLTQGTYAKVKYGQHAESGEAVAVKVLDKEQLVRSGMVEQIKREIGILKQVGAGQGGTTGEGAQGTRSSCCCAAQ